MYLTFYRRTDEHQYTFEQQYKAYMAGQALPVDKSLPYPRTHTVQVDSATVPTYLFQNIQQHLVHLRGSPVPPLTYTQFLIPKASGGFRTINAPNETLKEYQSSVADFLRDTAKILTHDAAFAYVQKRCPKHAIERHQNSKWFLKLDIKNFFPSMTYEFVRESLYQLYPFANMRRTLDIEDWDYVLKKCFLNGVLPQGSPASPILSNLAFIQYDLAISRKLQNFDGFNFVYTRYADDLLISCPFHFDHLKVAREVQHIIQGLFLIKAVKTRYGSSAGRNWNLGLMLNKDQQITVGHKRKERCKAMLFSFMTNGLNSGMTTQELQVLQGELAYVASIEPEYMETLDTKYRLKLNAPSYHTTMTQILKARTV